MEDHEYVFFWSGKSADEGREAGVEFALKKEIVITLDKEPLPISDRIMSIRLPL